MSNPGEENTLTKVEAEAEYLVNGQLDLLAQLEVQLRLVHKTLSNIEKLRSARYRHGPQLSVDDRAIILRRLHSQLEELDGHLETQRDSCRNMHEAVDSMQLRLKALRRWTAPSDTDEAPR